MKAKYLRKLKCEKCGFEFEKFKIREKTKCPNCEASREFLKVINISQEPFKEPKIDINNIEIQPSQSEQELVKEEQMSQLQQRICQERKISDLSIDFFNSLPFLLMQQLEKEEELKQVWILSDSEKTALRDSSREFWNYIFSKYANNPILIYSISLISLFSGKLIIRMGIKAKKKLEKSKGKSGNRSKENEDKAKSEINEQNLAIFKGG
jgi:DNA-directed RNA polymerase subunit RPC12/RpoP